MADAAGSVRDAQAALTTTAATARKSVKYIRLQKHFIVDPQGSFIYWWQLIVVLAFVYNLWVLCYRFAFVDINEDNQAIWFALDYGFADCIYAIDVFIGFRTSVLIAGVFQKNLHLIKVHYMNSTAFYLDCSCLLPLDFLYFSFSCRKSLVRINRLIKVYKFWNFVSYNERHSRYPILLRVILLLHNMFVLLHWNSCILKFCADLIPRANITNHVRIVNESADLGVYSTAVKNHECYTSYALCEDYIEYLYWSTTLLTINTPNKHSKMCFSHSEHYIVLFVEHVAGVLFSTFFLATFSSLIASFVQRQRDYHDRLDTIKRYMETHRLPQELQSRVIRWVDYLWSVNQNAEESSLSMLPEKFRTRILMHVYRSMLRKVGILKHIEPQEEFLSELVLRLNPTLFIPGEFVYKRGDVSRGMYFVNQGMVEMLDVHNNVVNTLQSGSYFGEEDILCMKRTSSKRQNTFRSVGYSYLLSLSKPDFWDVLKDYPVARIQIEAATFRRMDQVSKQESNALRSSRSKSLLNVAVLCKHCDLTQPKADKILRRFRGLLTSQSSDRKNARSSVGRLSISLEELYSGTLRNCAEAQCMDDEQLNAETFEARPNATEQVA